MHRRWTAREPGTGPVFRVSETPTERASWLLVCSLPFRNSSSSLQAVRARKLPATPTPWPIAVPHSSTPAVLLRPRQHCAKNHRLKPRPSLLRSSLASFNIFSGRSLQPSICYHARFPPFDQSPLILRFYELSPSSVAYLCRSFPHHHVRSCPPRFLFFSSSWLPIRHWDLSSPQIAHCASISTTASPHHHSRPCLYTRGSGHILKQFRGSTSRNNSSGMLTFC